MVEGWATKRQVPHVPQGERMQPLNSSSIEREGVLLYAEAKKKAGRERERVREGEQESSSSSRVE